MKYIIIPVIALGLTLSTIFCIEYKCEGEEMFPTYYGSPFIFKQKSLASSLEYFYSISGLFLNVIVWSLFLIIMRFTFIKLIEKTSVKRKVTVGYNISVGLLLVFAFINIYGAYITADNSFSKNSNYWYWNFDKESRDWGMTCEGKWKFLLL